MRRRCCGRPSDRLPKAFRCCYGDDKPPRRHSRQEGGQGGEGLMRQGVVWTGSIATTLILTLAPAAAQSQKVGDPPEAKNMRLVGSNDLQGRSAYQPTIHRPGDRYIPYIGHHGGTPAVPQPTNKLTGQAEFNGTSVLDVTDPAIPNICVTSRAWKATTRRAARRWCACATARACL